MEDTNDFWKFERSPSNNIFAIDDDTIDNRMFSKVVENYYDSHEFDNRDKDLRKASIVHKIVRKQVHKFLKEGTSIRKLVRFTEDKILSLCKQDRSTYFGKHTDSGIGFPVGVSINNVVAHDSELLKDNRILGKGDIVKFDFGVHMNGNIIDSAFTHIVDEDETNNVYENLLTASKDATYSAIAISGPDARLIELSEVISEIISSYELPIDTDFANLAINPVIGIGGHNIEPYKIHANKFIFSVPDEKIQGDSKMDEGEIFAIETFATTGDGTIAQDDDLNHCSHFMINRDCKSKRFFKKNTVYNSVKHRDGMPFSLSWCDKRDKKFFKDLKQGIQMQDITAFPPLMDMEETHVSQFEHTIRVKDGCVEVYSLGDDY